MVVLRVFSPCDFSFLNPFPFKTKRTSFCDPNTCYYFFFCKSIRRISLNDIYLMPMKMSMSNRKWNPDLLLLIFPRQKWTSSPERTCHWHSSGFREVFSSSISILSSGPERGWSVDPPILPLGCGRWEKSVPETPSAPPRQHRRNLRSRLLRLPRPDLRSLQTNIIKTITGYREKVFSKAEREGRDETKQLTFIIIRISILLYKAIDLDNWIVHDLLI